MLDNNMEESPKKQEHKESTEQDVIELTISEQYERFNVLLTLTSILLMLNAVGLLAITFQEGVWSSGPKVIKLKNSSTSTQLGMPIPYMAIYGDFGYIQDFSIFGGPSLNIFPKLPHATESYDGHLSETNPFYKIFGVEFKNKIYFMTCNPGRLVTVIDVKRGEHETIPGSFIPNKHFQSKVTGIQVGEFYWIHGGLIDDFNLYQFQLKSSIWVLSKEHWIQGPILPTFFRNIIGDYCAVAVNDSTVLLVFETKMVYFNFHSQEWIIKANLIQAPFCCSLAEEPFICTSLFDKNYQRQLILMIGFTFKYWIQWELETDTLKSNTMVLPSLNMSEYYFVNWDGISTYLINAELSVIKGEIYLIDGFNEYTEDIQLVWKMHPNGTFHQAVGPHLFSDEFETYPIEIMTYYKTPKVVSFYKSFKGDDQ